MPPNTVSVTRPGKWGNPFVVGAPYMPWLAIALGYRGSKDGQQQAAVALYEGWITKTPVKPMPVMGGDAIEFTGGVTRSTEQHCRGLAGGFAMSELPDLPDPPSMDEIRTLAGKSLACFCQPGSPCHGDVLLRLANAPVNARGVVGVSESGQGG